MPEITLPTVETALLELVGIVEALEARIVALEGK